MDVEFEKFKEAATKSIRFTKEANIKPCTICGGKGYMDKEEMTNYHRMEYTYWYEMCKVCAGNGRVLETIFKAQFYNNETKTKREPLTPGMFDEIMKTKGRK